MPVPLPPVPLQPSAIDLHAHFTAQRAERLADQIERVLLPDGRPKYACYNTTP